VKIFQYESEARELEQPECLQVKIYATEGNNKDRTRLYLNSNKQPEWPVIEKSFIEGTKNTLRSFAIDIPHLLKCAKETLIDSTTYTCSFELNFELNGIPQAIFDF
jgi:hypothetical protein